MVAMVTHYYEYVSCVFALVTPQRLLVRARVCVFRRFHPVADRPYLRTSLYIAVVYFRDFRP